MALLPLLIFFLFLPNNYFLIPTISKGFTSNKTCITSDEMVFIHGGIYEMGDIFDEGNDDEKPLHLVELTDFFIGKYEVSVGEYNEFVQDTKSNYPEWMEEDSAFHIHTGDDDYYKELGTTLTDKDQPIVGINWYNAIAFCNWMSVRNDYQPVYFIDGAIVQVDWKANGYRLPTEAEWEYAARSGGKKYKYAWGYARPNGNFTFENTVSRDFCWSACEGYNDGFEFSAPVDQFKQGDLGLYSMTGNVWEWCWDCYNSTYYEESMDAINPKGPEAGSRRTIRGGSWSYEVAFVRVANRLNWNPAYCFHDLGFRLARSAG